ncbi:MAG: hypothetical protein QM809_17325 [Gordonia sp. (in: high G+C Gram-positive bacteria)]|uniref:hypothetical protein n=1 Tax=Gordonia sp. (in: high G+C Gram-positive bacteria) TaxID=84139 RepID=UPI0039E2AA6A
MRKKTSKARDTHTEIDVHRPSDLPEAEPRSGESDDRQVPARAVALVTRIVEKAHRLQEPAVTKYVARLREKHPDDTPEQLLRRLERRFLNTVTASGGAVGAAAAIPGVGTVTALSALSADTAIFIEASALFALATAEVYGIAPHESERRRALVLTVAMGEEGLSALGKVAGARSTDALNRLMGPALAPKRLASLNNALTKRLVRRFALRRAPVLVGKLIPGGIGAAVGGIGNRALGSMVLRNAREAFGPPPRFWDVDGQVIDLGTTGTGTALTDTPTDPPTLRAIDGERL